MKKEKTKALTIGVPLSSMYDPYQNAIWVGIQDQASVQEAQVLCFAGGALDYPDIYHVSRTALYKLISPNNVDVLILISGCLGIDTSTAALIKFLQEHSGIPAISIGIEIPGVPSIVIDNEIGMRKLVSHMIETHRCQRIAFIKGPENNDEANARFNAYLQSLAEHNIAFDPELVCPGNFEEESGLNAVRLLVDEKKVKFDALIGADDLTILYAIEPLKQRGLRIPEDVKVAGFDDIEESQSSLPPLTTVRQPLFELGIEAVKKSFDLIIGKSVRPIQMIPTNLMTRSSCGCTPDKAFKSLTKVEKSNAIKEMNIENLSASILSELESTYSFDFSQFESSYLPGKLEALLSVINESITTPSAGNKMGDILTDIISRFFRKGITVSLWRGILMCIFEKLSTQISSKKKLSALNSLWNKSLTSLYQIESYLQAQSRINFEEESIIIQEIGDRLITSFNMQEIKSILMRSLPILNINECYLLFYEEEKIKARLIFDMSQKEATIGQETLFPSQDLKPGGLSYTQNKSYYVMPLISEHDQFGFVIFELSDPNGKKLETLAQKIASAVNGAKLIEKINRQNLELRKSEENLQITLNSIGDAVISTDALGKISGINPVAVELIGWSEAKAKGRPLIDAFHIIDSESRNEVESPVEKVMRIGQVVSHDKPTIFISKDGTERHINYSCAPIRSADGKIVGVVLVFRDVTKQYKTEEQFRQSQKMESIGQLAGGVAHDFNNILAGISGCAELLNIMVGKDKKFRKYTNMILDATEEAAGLTHKLLAFSRKARVQTTPVDVHASITDAVRILEHSIDRRISINTDLNAAVPTITGDPSQIQNIVLNLGVNARDAMPHGGELTIATANVDLNEDYCRNSLFDIEPGFFVEIIVRDTGIGMSRETQKRIFDPFFTTKGVGKGTGLGLAAVYGIVSDHHGAIHVYSEVEKGAVFKVFLPANKSTVMPKKSAEAEIQTGSGRILVVDDKSIIRNTLKSLLCDIGYEVVLAKDGEDGVEIYKKKQEDIDIVILDMVMPKMNGRDAFIAMKKINHDVKILLSSGFSRDAGMDDLLEQGAVGFIQKPYRRLELSRVLANAMKSSDKKSE